MTTKLMFEFLYWTSAVRIRECLCMCKVSSNKFFSRMGILLGPSILSNRVLHERMMICVRCACSESVPNRSTLRPLHKYIMVLYVGIKWSHLLGTLEIGTLWLQMKNDTYADLSHLPGDHFECCSIAQHSLRNRNNKTSHFNVLFCIYLRPYMLYIYACVK